MDLFLIRHARAADGELYARDAERPLTASEKRGRVLVVASGGGIESVPTEAERWWELRIPNKYRRNKATELPDWGCGDSDCEIARRIAD